MTKNHVLNVLYLAHGIYMLASIMLSPLYAIFAENVHASVVMIGYLGSTFFVAKTVATIFMRLYGDRLGHHRYLLVFGYLLKAGSWFAMLTVSWFGSLFLIQSVLGLSEGLQSPSFRTLVAKHLDHGKQVSEYATWEIVLAVTGIAGTAIGGFIAGHYGFAPLFIMIGSLALCSAFIAGTAQISE